MTHTIFDDIVSGKMDAWKVWEDEKHLAFLTPFPNTPGFTVLIPKRNLSDYLFAMKDEEYHALLDASKTVAHILEKAFDTPRIAMIVEGTGVAYVHIKLIPLHGDLASQTNVWSEYTEFTDVYRGWITTAEGPRMSDEQLNELQMKIRSVQ